MLEFMGFAPVFLIINPDNFPLDEARFQTIANKALSHFEKEIGPVNRAVTIRVSPPDCLRTGYNRRSKEVVFCPAGNVLNAGLDSVDVINHELFHAFLCQTDETLCSHDESDDLHEALADTFSYQLNPDRYFGENFYKTYSYIRTYSSTWRPGLVKAEHEKGTALASTFIAERRALKDLLPLFKAGKSPQEVEIKATGRETSPLNRYRLRAGEVLKLSFIFSPEAGVSKVKWKAPEGLVIRDTGTFQFDIEVTEALKESRTPVIFFSREGIELGRYSFYFGKDI